MKGSILAVLLLVVPWSAVAQSVEPPAERVERWSIGAGVRVGGLELYPMVGVAVSGLRRFGRWRLGGELAIYAPKTDGDVRRFASSASFLGRFSIVESRYVNWLLDLEVGLAVFHDDYVSQSYFSDVTRLAPGVGLGTGLEFMATERLRIVLDVRGLYYVGGRVADHDWLELGLGMRWLLR